MNRYSTLADAAEHFQKHPRTIDNWLRAGYIRGYDDGSRQIKVDIREIELVLATNPRMRDGRKRNRYGKATIVPLAVNASPGADQ